MSKKPEDPSDHPIVVYDVQLTQPHFDENTPPNFRDSPIQILRYDLGLVLRHIAEIPNIFRPMPKRGDSQKDVAFIGVFLQVVLVITSLIVTGLVISSFFFGFPWPIITATILISVIFSMSFVQGRIKNENKGTDDKFPNEAWLFVNGVATSASGLQLILNEMNRVFGRRVIGIHNNTFGIWWDLVECMLQRDLLWPTRDVRVGYQTICKYIRDPTKTKVVLMCHSQGGIIMSTWVDQLLSDFDVTELRKVEIYTFAAAANHFAVPSTTVSENGRRYVFGIVEHFVNTRDYVSLIGLLEFSPIAPEGTVPGELPSKAAEGRFAGRIFKRLGHTGHLLITHYLKNGDSILDHPTVEKYSQLAKYKGGKTPEVEQRVWKLAEQTEVPSVKAHPPAPITNA